jgi:hypothetical protein
VFGALVLSGVGGEIYPGRERIELLLPIEPLLSRLAISLRFDSAVALGSSLCGEAIEEAGELAISSQAYCDDSSACVVEGMSGSNGPSSLPDIGAFGFGDGNVPPELIESMTPLTEGRGG